jgi:Polyketide cyclase / dehydrase and lipid transport
MIYALIAVAIVVLFLIFVTLQSSQFIVQRSTTINAPADAVFEQVNDFHKWAAWSPWEEKDPDMKRTYEGPPAGVGTMYAWAGDKNVGEGRMTLTDSEPNRLIRIKLEFFKPFAGTNTAAFAFQPSGRETNVTWTMTGHKAFMVKLFCMFVSMDKMIGNDFEKGLAKLKDISERAPARV